MEEERCCWNCACLGDCPYHGNKPCKDYIQSDLTNPIACKLIGLPFSLLTHTPKETKRDTIIYGMKKIGVRVILDPREGRDAWYLKVKYAQREMVLKRLSSGIVPTGRKKECLQKSQ